MHSVPQVHPSMFISYSFKVSTYNNIGHFISPHFQALRLEELTCWGWWTLWPPCNNSSGQVTKLIIIIMSMCCIIDQKWNNVRLVPDDVPNGLSNFQTAISLSIKKFIYRYISVYDQCSQFSNVFLAVKPTTIRNGIQKIYRSDSCAKLSFIFILFITCLEQQNYIFLCVDLKSYLEIKK